jgi:hypothetical protein
VALADGSLLTFGWALRGQLGLADPDNRYHRPVATAAAAEDQLFPAAVTTCLLVDPPSLPAAPVSLPPVAFVAAGQRHTVLVTTDGRVFTCGEARFGVLGYLCPTGVQRLFRQVDLSALARPAGAPGLSDSAPSPAAADQEPAPAPAASAAAAGGFHTVVLLRDGRLVSFGSNSSGQLGRDERGGVRAAQADQARERQDRASDEPGLVDGVERAVAVACGALTTLIVTVEGSALACGSNTFGRYTFSSNITSNRNNSHSSSVHHTIKVQVYVEHRVCTGAWYIYGHATVMISQDRCPG